MTELKEHINIDYRVLTSSFMEKLSVGSRFTLNDKTYFVKCVGKWQSKHFKDSSFKTITVKCEENNELIKFFYFFGYDGNPSSKSKNASVRQHRFLRDIEGVLVLDLINKDNVLHKKSDVFLMATEINN